MPGPEPGGGVPLEGQVIVITGAAQGLGAGIARYLHAAGARLLLLDRDADRLAEIVSACPGAVSAVVDLADASATERALAEVVTEPVDTLIHNAAILRMEPLEDVTLAAFQATLNVGIQAGFQLVKALWPAMKTRGGALVFVSSRSGIEGFADETAYCATKHALEGFSKSLALEGEPYGILSVTVTPGMYMHTPMSETNYPPELREKWVDPIELAPAFAFLATRPLHLSGQRLDAWALSRPDAAPRPDAARRTESPPTEPAP
ncbi:MAG: SDR family oxidoreductase [Gemmatimonadetes bacterium]|nr:SDR family oxidoreductase [Gemmatimonadota bacterium]NNF38034.1 SDR family oxidoreductase [Gemmatimonadota bacterium]